MTKKHSQLAFGLQTDADSICKAFQKWLSLPECRLQTKTRIVRCVFHFFLFVTCNFLAFFLPFFLLHADRRIAYYARCWVDGPSQFRHLFSTSFLITFSEILGDLNCLSVGYEQKAGLTVVV